MLPPQVSPVGGRLSNFVEGWKRITNDPYVLSIVAKGYRLRFTSPPLLRQTPWEIRSPQDPQEILLEQISLMLQKNSITEVPPNSPGFYSNVFLVRKATGGWRPVIDLKSLNAHIHAPHFRMFTTNSVLSSVQRGDYAFKIDLQDAYFHVPIHPSSRKYLRFAFENKVYQFGVPYGVRLPAPSGDLGDTISGRLANSPSRSRSFTPTSSSANEYARPCQFCSKREEIQSGPDSGYPVSRNLVTSGLRGSFPSRVQSLGDSCLCTPSILPPCTILYSSVPAHGVTQLGLRSHPSGSTVPETPATSFPFVRSDRPVYTTVAIRPSGSCQPSMALAGPTFSYLRNPSPHVSGGVHTFYGLLHAGVGCSHGGFPDFGYLDPYRPQASHQLFGAQGGISCPTALGSNAPGPPGYDRYGQFDSSFIYQQTRGDPFPHLVAVDRRASPLVRGSEHNSLSKTYTRLSERDSRPPISSEPANTDRVVPPPRDSGTYLQGLGHTRSRHVWDTVELPPSSVHVSNSRAKSPSVGCFVLGLAVEVNVHVCFPHSPCSTKSCRNFGTLRRRR